VRVAARPGFELGPSPHEALPVEHPPLSLGGGLVDVRLAPWQDFARAYRRVLARPSSPLRYGDPRGHAGFRAAIAAMVTASRGVVCEPEQVLVTRGSQMAVALFARSVLRPGDVVAVEALGYPPAWAALREAGAELVPIAVDDRGLVVDALAELARRRRVRAVYVTPHHQYPTTVTLSAAQRIALLALAHRHGIAILEDDYDHEFHYDGRPVLPLASADARGVVVYVGTFSKVLAPGLRTGFVVAPSALIDRMAGARVLVDRQGDHALEAALAELLEEGTLERHIRRVRRIYRARRDAFVDDVARLFGDRLTMNVPSGGTAVWAHVRGIDVDAWALAALAAGVPFQSGRRFSLTGTSRSHARLGFVALSDVERARALRALAHAAKGLPRLTRSG
jgi:GntR family transcriptional regulator/MocR family aminotransferase